jgi:hypothetical protein
VVPGQHDLAALLGAQAGEQLLDEGIARPGRALRRRFGRQERGRAAHGQRGGTAADQPQEVTPIQAVAALRAIRPFDLSHEVSP